LHDADYLITGEGKTDEQTLLGKVPYVVAQLARRYDVPTLVMSGAIEGDVISLQRVFAGLQAAVSRPMPMEEALTQAESLLHAAARNLASLLRLSCRS
jgi:glycerate kinase